MSRRPGAKTTETLIGAATGVLTKLIELGSKRWPDSLFWTHDCQECSHEMNHEGLINRALWNLAPRVRFLTILSCKITTSFKPLSALSNTSRLVWTKRKTRSKASGQTGTTPKPSKESLISGEGIGGWRELGQTFSHVVASFQGPVHHSFQEWKSLLDSIENLCKVAPAGTLFVHDRAVLLQKFAQLKRARLRKLPQIQKELEVRQCVSTVKLSPQLCSWSCHSSQVEISSIPRPCWRSRPATQGIMVTSSSQQSQKGTLWPRLVMCRKLGPTHLALGPLSRALDLEAGTMLAGGHRGVSIFFAFWRVIRSKGPSWGMDTSYRGLLQHTWHTFLTQNMVKGSTTATPFSAIS